MSNTWQHVTPQPVRFQKLELIEHCWRLRTVAGGTEVTCGIFQTDVGLEVRADCSDDLLFSKQVLDLSEARAMAVQFRHTLTQELGRVEEMPLNE